MSEEQHYAYVLVEDEKWWNRRISRNKSANEVHAFVRRGSVGPKSAVKILFYVKRPAKQIRGFSDFQERITGTSDELWNLYGSETVFENRDEYDQFVGNRTKVTFVRFKNMQEFQKPVEFNEIIMATGMSRMAQGGRYMSRETVNSLIK